MANRFPLIVNTTSGNSVQEIPVGDFLDLSQSGISNSGNITVSGIISATGNITAGNILSQGDITAVGNITAANVNTPNADLAELYQADQSYAPGTVVEFGGSHEITSSKGSHSTSVAGVISTAPSYVMNSQQLGQHVLPVALTGRVPCMVVGNISKGDCLVSSHIPGAAQRLDMIKYQPGCIIGKSLQDYNLEQIGVIEIAVGRF